MKTQWCLQCSTQFGQIKQQFDTDVKRLQIEFNLKLSELNKLINTHLTNVAAEIIAKLEINSSTQTEPIPFDEGVVHEYVDIKIESPQFDHNESPQSPPNFYEDDTSQTFKEEPSPTKGPPTIPTQHTESSFTKTDINCSITTPKPFHCDKCIKSFSTRKDANRHQLAHKEKGKKENFVCDICPKVFSDKYVFATHRKSHTGESWHHCDICSKSFTMKNSLAVHMRTHTDERPYMCHQCCKTFKQSAPFRRHMRTHIVDKSHKCTLCERAFREKAQLMVHMLSHTGERPHVCPICKKGYTKRYHVRKHIANFHKIADVDAAFPCKKRRTNNTVVLAQ